MSDGQAGRPSDEDLPQELGRENIRRRLQIFGSPSQLPIISFFVVLIFLILLCPLRGSAEEPKRTTASQPASNPRIDLESAHFVLHTDLNSGKATEALDRMEVALQFAAHYWRRPHRGKIQCYLVEQLANWPDTALPHPMAKVVIGGVGGATISDKNTQAVRSSRLQSTIFASAVPGVAEHEVIHAYCAQNFGATGPEWYKEGMAEMAVYGETGGKGVRCPAERLALLQGVQSRTVHAILSAGENTNRMVQRMDAMRPQDTKRTGQTPFRAWTDEDSKSVRKVREDYVWNWALCHLLHHNANYADRFRTLGDEFLANKEVSFQHHFGPMQSEVMFEYGFFLEHVGVGYRVDLCAWDWQRRFRSLEERGPVRGRCKANRGWQASGLQVISGESYVFHTQGDWCIGQLSGRTTADGDREGNGRLVGIVMQEYKLSKPIQLGSDGKFVSPASGNLYLRCHDAWNQLADNEGDVVFEFLAP